MALEKLKPSTSTHKRNNTMTTQDNHHLLDLLTRDGVLLNVIVRYWRLQRNRHLQWMRDPGT